MRTFATIASRLNNVMSRNFALRQFRLPDLGEKIKEATVKRWRVAEGDVVGEFDTVAEVATDKLFTELPSPYSGTVRRLAVAEEENCNVGDVLMEIETVDIEREDQADQKLVDDDNQNNKKS